MASPNDPLATAESSISTSLPTLQRSTCNPDLSIVIVNWNTRNLLAECLQSLYAYPPDGEFEVFVVDNASTDGSAAMVRERFPQVRLIENRENVGFARANNQAFELCQGRYILLLNSDAQLTVGAANEMVRHMNEHHGVGIAGARLVHPDGRPGFCCGQFPTLWGECSGLMGLHRWDMSYWDEKQAVQVDWVSGACLMIRRECLNEIGGFDESSFMFGEEVDLCYRVTKAGWQVALVPCTPVIHIGAGSSGKTPDRISRLYRAKVQYFRKYQNTFAQESLATLIVLSMLAKLILYRLLSVVDKRWCQEHDFWRTVYSRTSEWLAPARLSRRTNYDSGC